MIAPRESLLVILTGATGHPIAVRNTDVIEVSDWKRWTFRREKSWVYDDIVVIVLPMLEPLKGRVEETAGSNGMKGTWCWIPVKGPLEEVVFALNQGVDTYKSNTG